MIVIVALLNMIPGILMAQPKEFMFETESTGDGNTGGEAFSQYIFFNSARKKNGIGLNGYMRYFDVSMGPKHGEFAIGPTFDLGVIGELQTNMVKFTTDGSLGMGATLITSIGGKTFVFISDPKLYLNRRPSTLFHRELSDVDGKTIIFYARGQRPPRVFLLGKTW
jgi:hypothetical protein